MPRSLVSFLLSGFLLVCSSSPLVCVTVAAGQAGIFGNLAATLQQQQGNNGNNNNAAAAAPTLNTVVTGSVDASVLFTPAAAAAAAAGCTNPTFQAVATAATAGAAPTVESMMIAGSPAYLVGLVAGTNYNVVVNAMCYGNAQPATSAAMAVTTMTAAAAAQATTPTAPTINTVNAQATMATVTFTPGATPAPAEVFQIIATPAAGAPVVMNAYFSPANIMGLAANTKYTFTMLAISAKEVPSTASTPVQATTTAANNNNNNNGQCSYTTPPQVTNVVPSDKSVQVFFMQGTSFPIANFANLLFNTFTNPVFFATATPTNGATAATPAVSSAISMASPVLIAGVQASTQYTVTVTMMCCPDCPPMTSNAVQAITLAAPLTTAPAAPAINDAEATCNTINVCFTAVANNVATEQFFATATPQNANNAAAVTVIADGLTSCIMINGLQPCTTYQVTVTSVSTANVNSVPSTPKTVMTSCSCNNSPVAAVVSPALGAFQIP